MGIITLTTDFGYNNWFVGTMKGVILSIAPDATIVDLNNEIYNFDVNAAAFSLAASYAYFPKGTIHVAVVDPGVGGTRRALAVKAGGHFFIAPDNGILTPILEHAESIEAYAIENEEFLLKPVSATFHGRDIFAPAAAHVTNGTPLSKFGRKVIDPVTLEALHVNRVEKNLYEGEIAWIDRFGNLITNVPASYVDGARSVEVLFAVIARRFIGMNTSYDSVPAGKPAVLVGSTGYLEIGINQGSAAETFGLNRRCRFRLVVKP
ncbi:SAM-dependent chlorinase/fluorinase [bacterium]|nr:SAM-dependent chlorinase/fluorinase [bacterium]